MAPSTISDLPIGPAPVSVKYTKLFIDGQFVDAVSGRTFETLDPRNGEVISKVAEADKQDVDVAVKAARKAFDHGPWPRLSGYARGRILLKFADLLEHHFDELAALETLDNGKPLDLVKYVDLPMALRLLRSFAGFADKICGKTVKIDGPYHAYTLLEPIGVVGQIIPWNFPLIMFFLKISPALAAGNTIVLKTAEQTPLSALFCASLLKEAGLPPGVLNILSGFGPTAGAAISSHNDVDKIAFTGSTDVGKLVMEAAAKSNLKAVSLELGGKSPMIVLDDADVDVAVELAHLALFFNVGQCCVAGSRVFVQEGIYDEFLRKVVDRAKRRVTGDSFQSGVDHGPVVDKQQFDRVLGYVEIGKREGARLVTGGCRIGSRGFYIEPTIFADVEDYMRIAREEIFGPVMSVLKFRTIDEVIQRANDTAYGLAAGIVTKDLNSANRLTRSLRAGTVWINCYHVFDPALPFGGYKMSGIGRENGKQVLYQYSQVKSVVTPVESPWL
ncbi:hypothetical protein SELMODRAFT_180171 [Selaginella moellendorffii]|uniref:Aldehyde dehydrogenase domain-containing protein n=1 Tax=Selaginella moellendorffii TaxID=88036 RepID=D8SJ91_SELML|nr:aldehyde dehydrogenase family 2 member B7, mitochondrial [Selaginella moellendorffii]EFJ15630.1 hypothetical protein SELMODRAFT_180171 [Selaginella moellendorffii]|eukprot:XP_024543980.1 aldehyde dehydrogenase family 2 member B7, mitochondrial [Selaginella moellendorffii]